MTQRIKLILFFFLRALGMETNTLGEESGTPLKPWNLVATVFVSTGELSEVIARSFLVSHPLHAFLTLLYFHSMRICLFIVYTAFKSDSISQQMVKSIKPMRRKSPSPYLQGGARIPEIFLLLAWLLSFATTACNIAEVWHSCAALATEWNVCSETSNVSWGGVWSLWTPYWLVTPCTCQQYFTVLENIIRLKWLFFIPLR